MIQLKTIRDNVVAELKAANISGIGQDVFPSRSRKIWPGDTDHLLVYLLNTDADDQGTAPVIYKLSSEIVVQVVAQKAATDQDLEDRLDQITQAVLDTLQAPHEIVGPLSGALDWLTLRGIRPTLSAEGEILKGSQNIIFTGIWSAALPSETQVPADAFLRTGTTLGAPTLANAPKLDTEFTTPTGTP